MAYEKIKGTAYYLGALSTFTTLIGVEVYTRASHGPLNLEDNVSMLSFGLPAITLIPIGLYCIGKSASYFANHGKNKDDKH